MDQQVPTLPQAATSNNVSGALQQMLLARMTTPQQDQNLQQNRRDQLAQYQGALREDPTPGYSALDHSLYSWIGNMGRMRPSVAAMQGVAEGGKFRGNQSGLVHQGDVNAAKAGYDDAKFEETQADAELRGLSSGLKVAGGKQPSPEILRTVYNGARNEAAQIAKGKQFADDTERNSFIESWANRAVQNYLTQFAAQPTGPRGTEGEVPGVAGVAPPQQPPQATQPPQEAPSEIISSGAVLPGVAPELQERAVITLQEWQMNKKKTQDFANNTNSPHYQEALRNMAAARQELLNQYKIDPLKMGGAMPTPTPTAPNAATPPSTQPQQPVTGLPGIVNAPNRNLPREEQLKSTAKEMGAKNAKEDDEISAAGTAAKEQYDAYLNLEKIDPNTNAFAGAHTYIGLALNGLGIDSSSPMIQNAIKNREAETIINQMRNAALRGEKGVQTRSDEVRIEKELAKLTDPKQAWNYLIQLGKERSLRKMELQEFSAGEKAANNGLPIGVRDKWMTQYKEDPLTQEFGGKIVFRSQIIDAFLKKYPDAAKQEAVDYWRDLEQQFKSRQRGK